MENQIFAAVHWTVFQSPDIPNSTARAEWAGPRRVSSTESTCNSEAAAPLNHVHKTYLGMAHTHTHGGIIYSLGVTRTNRFPKVRRAQILRWGLSPGLPAPGLQRQREVTDGRGCQQCLTDTIGKYGDKDVACLLTYRGERLE
jgi:hypothetical protein